MKHLAPIASIGHSIAGKITAPEGEKTQPVHNPATGAHTGNVSLATV